MLMLSTFLHYILLTHLFHFLMYVYMLLRKSFRIHEHLKTQSGEESSSSGRFGRSRGALGVFQMLLIPKGFSQQQLQTSQPKIPIRMYICQCIQHITYGFQYRYSILRIEYLWFQQLVCCHQCVFLNVFCSIHVPSMSQCDYCASGGEITCTRANLMKYVHTYYLSMYIHVSILKIVTMVMHHLCYDNIIQT